MKVLYRFLTFLILGILCLGNLSFKQGFHDYERKQFQDSPNIILLVTDDQRWDALGAYGNSIIQTPNLDRLAEQGVLFENMFVTTSICAPSRASIMTGQYASRHRIWDFDEQLSPEQLNHTYLGLLKKAGYQIGFVGKWGVGLPPDSEFSGLDYNKAFPGQGKYFLQYKDEKRHLTSVLGDQALEFLEQHAADKTPFSLSISFKAAHIQDSYAVTSDLYQYDPALSGMYEDAIIPRPRKADPKYYEQLPDFLKNSENRIRWAVRYWGPARYQESQKGYYRLISGVDSQVGRILEKLEEEGLDDNTIIIFTSDNGMFTGEYGLTGKWLPHEESIRVPLVIFDPKIANTKQTPARREEMVLNIDLAPTMLDMAGLPVPESMQGKSLVPVLKKHKGQWRREFFYEHLFEHPRIPATEAVRTERWKYIRYVDLDPVYEELYDLKNDPNEEENLMLSDGNERIKKMMRQKWEEWHEKVRR